MSHLSHAGLKKREILSNQDIRFDIKKDNKTFKKYLRITLKESVGSPIGGSEKIDTAFRLASPYISVEPDSYHILSFEERHNYDFTKVTKGYCQVLWYDARRNLIGK